MGLPPRQPISAKKNKSNPRVLFIVAGLCILLGAVLLGVIAMIVFSSSGKTTNSANTNGNTPANGGTTPQAVASPSASDTGASPTADASPSASGTPYPGQQYIDSAQMVTSDPATTPNQQPTTTFKVGSNMYVTFKLHPPSQGGAVCSYWYLGGKQVTSYVSAVKRSSHSSYTYAIYGNPGQAYVELYWASDKSCSGKILAQHVDFTVTG
jgi:cytoskeletal protein RodZ